MVTLCALYGEALEMENPLLKYYKRVFKDLEPAKDRLSELTEKEPKSIGEMKRRLSKKMGKS